MTPRKRWTVSCNHCGETSHYRSRDAVVFFAGTHNCPEITPTKRQDAPVGGSGVKGAEPLSLTRSCGKP